MLTSCTPSFLSTKNESFFCDHAVVKGTLLEEQCISALLEGFSCELISGTLAMFSVNAICLVTIDQ